MAKRRLGLKPGVTPLPHQHEATRKIVRHGSQILSHGLGSGKTITSILGHEALKRARGVKGPALVVPPAALVENYRTGGLKKFLRPASRKDYHIVSREKFRRDAPKHLKKHKPSTLIIDEAHGARDPKSKTFQALQHAAERIPHRIVMTGSLVSNHPRDIVSLLSLVRGKRMSVADFERRHIGHRKISPGLIGRLRGVKPGHVETIVNKQDLKKVLDRYVHHFRGSEEFKKHIPTVHERDVSVPMSRQQSKLYQFALRKKLGPVARWRIKHNLPPGKGEATSFLSALSLAREVSGSPHILSKKIRMSEAVAHSPKLKAAVESMHRHLSEHPKHKVVIYSNMRKSSLDPVKEHLVKSRVPHGEFHGGIPDDERQRHVREFNRGKRRVLLVSPSGAEGLDLKGATLFQRLDPHWNPERMAQAKGRVARYKSHASLPSHMRKVKVENYTSSVPRKWFGLGRKETSVEEWVESRAREKKRLNRELLDIVEKKASILYPGMLVFQRIKRASIRQGKISLAANPHVIPHQPIEPTSPHGLGHQRTVKHHTGTVGGDVVDARRSLTEGVNDHFHVPSGYPIKMDEAAKDLGWKPSDVKALTQHVQSGTELAPEHELRPHADRDFSGMVRDLLKHREKRWDAELDPEKARHYLNERTQTGVPHGGERHLDPYYADAVEHFHQRHLRSPSGAPLRDAHSWLTTKTRELEEEAKPASEKKPTAKPAAKKPAAKKKKTMTKKAVAPEDVLLAILIGGFLGKRLSEKVIGTATEREKRRLKILGFKV